MPTNKDSYYKKLRADEQLIYEQRQLKHIAKSERESSMLSDIQKLEYKLFYLAKQHPFDEGLFDKTRRDMIDATRKFVHFKPY